jgi:hypothetical protein
MIKLSWSALDAEAPSIVPSLTQKVQANKKLGMELFSIYTSRKTGCFCNKKSLWKSFNFFSLVYTKKGMISDN